MDRAQQMILRLAGDEIELIGQSLKACNSMDDLLFLIGRLSRVDDSLGRVLWDCIPVRAGK